MKVIFCFNLFFLFISSGATASLSSLYVAQYQVGSGTGRDCAQAMPVSYFNNPVNWGSGVSQIGPGTVVHLCGIFTGAPGSNILTFHGSGTLGHPITLLFEPNAKLTAPYFSQAIYARQSYLVIDGGQNGIIENTDNGTHFSYHMSSVGIEADNISDSLIKNLTIQNLYVHTNDTPGLADASVDRVYAVHFYQSNNLTLDHNIVHDVQWGLVGSGSGLIISNNDIYHSGHGTAGGAQNFAFFNNHIHDPANWGTTSDAYHQDGFHLWSFLKNGSPANINGNIYNNLFDGDWGTCCITAQIYLEGNDQNINVFNNVFLTAPDHAMHGLWLSAHYGSGGNSNSVYNNYFETGFHSNGGGSAILADGQLNFTAVNNIMRGGLADIGVTGSWYTDPVTKVSSFFPTTLSSRGIDNNIYEDLIVFQDYNTFMLDSSLSLIGLPKKSYQTLAQWTGACNCDFHSKLLNASQIMVDGTGHLLSGSPAASMGINLSSLNISALTLDSVGNRRPAGAWAVGAYNVGATGLPGPAGSNPNPQPTPVPTPTPAPTPSCKPTSFFTGSVTVNKIKVTSVPLNSNFMVSCNFGTGQTNSITLNLVGRTSGPSCKWVGWDSTSPAGSAALFSCNSGNVSETLPVNCILQNIAPDHYCAIPWRGIEALTIK